jgi:ATP-dependent Lon protease
VSQEGGEREKGPLLTVGQERVEIPTVLPLLPVRDVVMFPGITIPLAIGRQKSLAALEHAGEGGFMIVATQRDPTSEEPSIEELFPVACVVRVMRIIDARRDGKQAIVVGVVRTRISYPPVAEEPALLMRLEPLTDVEDDSPELEAMWKQVIALAQKVIDLHDDYPDEWKSFVSGIPSPGLMADVIGSTLPLAPEEKVALLAETDPARRLGRVARHLEREVTIAETQRALGSGSESEEMDPGRRERLLRGRMRDITCPWPKESEIHQAGSA